MSKKLDITDQIFGRLKAIVTDWYKTKETGQTYWFCQCIDNNIVSVYIGSLRNGHTQSCGCLQKEKASEKCKNRREDISDQIFGRLLALVTDWYKTKETGITHWFCQCEDNNIVSVPLSSLQSGNTKSCGCLRKEIIFERINITDQIFHRLQAIVTDWYKTNLTGKTYWWCQCECNEIVSVRLDSLMNGNTKSCGCLFKELTFKRKGENHPNWQGGKVIIICKYCGKEKEVWPCEKDTAQFCDRKCEGKWKSENYIGENSFNWKDGITPLQIKVRYSLKYREFHKQILKRDKYTCQASKEIGRDLQVHHIKSFAKILKENNIITLEQALECKELWDEKKVITLSEKWHSGIKTDNPNAFHRLYGTMNFTEQDFSEWFNKFEVINKGVNYV